MASRLRRHIWFFAILLVVSTQAGVRAEASDWKADIAAIEERFGISIEYQDFEFPLETIHGNVTGTKPNTDNLIRYVPILKAELFKYPRGVFRKLGVKRIVLASKLAFKDHPRAAVPELITRTFFLDVCIGRHVPNYQRRVVHHDFFHFIDWFDDYSYDDDTWRALNPPDFEYDSKRAPKPAEDVFSVTYDLPGFLTKYSTTAVHEDKAEIFSLLMTDWLLVEKRSKEDEIIAEKVRLIKQLLRAWSSDFNEDFWQCLREGTPPEGPGCHTDRVTSIYFSPDGKLALSGSRDKTVKLWDVETNTVIATWEGHTDCVNYVVFSPDSKRALSASKDKTVKLWDVETNTVIATWEGHMDPVTFVAFSPNGRHALSGSVDNTLKLWDIQTGKEIATWKGHTGPITCVAFRPDSTRALSGSMDSTLKLWELQTGKEIATWVGHASWVTTVAFSPDGKLALSGSVDGTLKLWNVQTGKEIATWKGHMTWITSVAFSPDGKQVLSASLDGVLKLWDVQTGKEIPTWKEHEYRLILSVAFTQEGECALIGAERNCEVKLWKVKPEKQ